MAAAGDAGVVDQYVDRPEAPPHRLDHGLVVGEEVDRGAERLGALAHRSDFVDDLARRALVAPIVHGDVRAIFRERETDRATHAPAAARDQREPAFQSSHQMTPTIWPGTKSSCGRPSTHRA